MKINPAFGVILGIILLVIGVVTHLVTLDIAGGFVAVVAAAKIMRDRRGGAGRGVRS